MRAVPQVESLTSARDGLAAELSTLKASVSAAEARAVKAEAELQDANKQRERMTEHLDKMEVGDTPDPQSSRIRDDLHYRL